jgi:hypothetical protein
MSDQPTPSQTDPEEEFTPRGALFLMVLYIIIFAAAWGLIYFSDLLARR